MLFCKYQKKKKKILKFIWKCKISRIANTILKVKNKFGGYYLTSKFTIKL